MRQMNLTMSSGRKNTNPPMITPSTDFMLPVVAALPFAKRKFSSGTLSSQSLNYNLSSTKVLPISAPIYSYSRNLRHVTQYSEDTNQPKMLWGKPTWFLFHMMAEKIKPSFFLQNRMEILQLINTICINLPCPTCAEHAKINLQKSQFFQIQTIDELKNMLFQFHNTVNVNKGTRVFLFHELTQYSQAIPVNIIENFIIEFSRKSKSIRLLADDMHRQNIVQQLKEWFQKNISIFT